MVRFFFPLVVVLRMGWDEKRDADCVVMVGG